MKKVIYLMLMLMFVLISFASATIIRSDDPTSWAGEGGGSNFVGVQVIPQVNSSHALIRNVSIQSPVGGNKANKIFIYDGAISNPNTFNYLASCDLAEIYTQCDLNYPIPNNKSAYIVAYYAPGNSLYRVASSSTRPSTYNGLIWNRSIYSSITNSGDFEYNWLSNPWGSDSNHRAVDWIEYEEINYTPPIEPIYTIEDYNLIPKPVYISPSSNLNGTSSFELTILGSRENIWLQDTGGIFRGEHGLSRYDGKNIYEDYFAGSGSSSVGTGGVCDMDGNVIFGATCGDYSQTFARRIYIPDFYGRDIVLLSQYGTPNVLATEWNGTGFERNDSLYNGLYVGYTGITSGGAYGFWNLTGSNNWELITLTNRQTAYGEVLLDGYYWNETLGSWISRPAVINGLTYYQWYDHVLNHWPDGTTGTYNQIDGFTLNDVPRLLISQQHYITYPTPRTPSTNFWKWNGTQWIIDDLFNPDEFAQSYTFVNDNNLTINNIRLEYVFNFNKSDGRLHAKTDLGAQYSTPLVDTSTLNITYEVQVYVDSNGDGNKAWEALTTIVDANSTTVDLGIYPRQTDMLIRARAVNTDVPSQKSPYYLATGTFSNQQVYSNISWSPEQPTVFDHLNLSVYCTGANNTYLANYTVYKLTKALEGYSYTTLETDSVSVYNGTWTKVTTIVNDGSFKRQDRYYASVVCAAEGDSAVSTTPVIALDNGVEVNIESMTNYGAPFSSSCVSAWIVNGTYCDAGYGGSKNWEFIYNVSINTTRDSIDWYAVLSQPINGNNDRNLEWLYVNGYIWNYTSSTWKEMKYGQAIIPYAPDMCVADTDTITLSHPDYIRTVDGLDYARIKWFINMSDPDSGGVSYAGCPSPYIMCAGECVSYIDTFKLITQQYSLQSCLVNWQCTAYGPYENDAYPCLSVTDVNNCGIEFIGLLSDYDSTNSLTILSPTETNYCHANNINLTYIAISSNETIDVCRWGLTYNETYPASCSASLLFNASVGENNLTVYFNTTNGNNVSDNVLFNTTADAIPPTVTIVSPLVNSTQAKDLATETFSVSTTITDICGLYLCWYNHYDSLGVPDNPVYFNCNNGVNNLNIPVDYFGTHTLYIYAEDYDGNQHSDSVVFSITQNEVGGGGGGGSSQEKEVEVPVPFFVREKTYELTCGYDADQDGLLCDPNEDWISCPDDCDMPSLDQLLCLGEGPCVWREAWFLKLLFAMLLMVTIYMIYTDLQMPRSRRSIFK